jgi:DNA-binding SARP family transcriptional activator
LGVGLTEDIRSLQYPKKEEEDMNERNILKMHFFGELQIQQGKRLINNFPTQKSKSLLCYLVMNRYKYLSRDKLIGLFWSEKSERKAKGCLNTTLWRLRCLLEQENTTGENYLLFENGNVSFNRYSNYWLDVEEFEGLIEKAKGLKGDEKVNTLERAVQLYQGAFLEGLYDDWIIFERERLEGIYLELLSELMEYYGSKSEYSKGIVYGKKILSHDPLRETIHRALMKLYYLSGNRASAIRQYKLCHKLLKKELKVSPMEETTSL